jgi:hypothetical protein
VSRHSTVRPSLSSFSFSLPAVTVLAALLVPLSLRAQEDDRDCVPVCEESARQVLEECSGAGGGDAECAAAAAARYAECVAAECAREGGDPDEGGDGEDGEGDRDGEGEEDGEGDDGEGDDGGDEDSSCAGSCREAARVVRSECFAAGGGEEECFSAHRAAYDECLLTACGIEPDGDGEDGDDGHDGDGEDGDGHDGDGEDGGDGHDGDDAPDCEVSCRGAARAAQAACREAGGSESECDAARLRVLTDCLAAQCLPACEDLCAFTAREALRACFEAGGSESDCFRERQAAFKACADLECAGEPVAEALLAGTEQFVRGDSNGDARVDISDAVETLNSLFLSSGPIFCEDAGDANDDGRLDISDPIALLNALFLGGRVPAPHPDPGFDATFDLLTCVP